MKITTKVAIATAFVALAACGSNNNANNTADMNASTDLNAGTTDMNATDMNGGTSDMNATGNMDMNATGSMNAAGNTATTNNTM